MVTSILLVTILMFLQGAREIKGANENSWYLFNNDLFYFNAQEKFSAQEAQELCVDNDMTEIIQSREFVELDNLMYLKYGKYKDEVVDKHLVFFPPMWVLDKGFLYNRSVNTSSNICDALVGDRRYANECGTKRGLICKTKISGASLQYKNGTQLEVGADEVIHYCDPESNKNDELLEYCLIKFYRMLL